MVYLHLDMVTNKAVAAALSHSTHQENPLQYSSASAASHDALDMSAQKVVYVQRLGQLVVSPNCRSRLHRHHSFVNGLDTLYYYSVNHLDAVSSSG